MVGSANPQSAILAAREQRAARTRQFLDRLRLPTIVLTINAPGPNKNAPWVARVMAQGTAAIRNTLDEQGFVVYDAASCESAAGPEWRGAVQSRSSTAAYPGKSDHDPHAARAQYQRGDDNVGGVDPAALTLKRLTVGIEESHRLGRLFDIDVFIHTPTPLGRTALGLAARRCLVCDRPAHECVRSRRHRLPELYAKIATLVE